MGAVFCKERKINMKRCFSLLLSLVLLFSLLPGTVLASGQDKLLASGTISLADGLSGGDYSGTIVLEPPTDGEAFLTQFHFTGTSCSYEIFSYREVTGTFYLSFTVQDGPGVICGQTYYYVEGGTATTDRNQATSVTLDGTGTLSVDLTIPKARVISGRFVSANGDGVVWNSEVGPWLNVAFSDGQPQRCRLTVDKDGTWSTTLDPRFTGQAILSFPITSEYSTNILTDRTYYYNSASTSAVTNEADASSVTLLGSEDLTGLDLYVDTGWLLSGQIYLPEGGYVEGGTASVSIFLTDEIGNRTNYSNAGTVGSNGGSYSITVPKQPAKYDVTLQINQPSGGVSSNIYWGAQISGGSVSVSGDTHGPNFTLVRARATVTGTVHRPEGVSGSFFPIIYVEVLQESSSQSYMAYPSISEWSDSASFSAVIPPSEAGTQYRLYYRITGASGLLCDTSVYLCQNGSLTTDLSQAGTFSLDQPTAHEFTLLTSPPFAAGVIRCPEGLEQTTNFVVYPQRASEITTLEFPQGGVEVMVGPGNGQQDEEGHWFSTYSLNDPSFTVGTRYHLVCYSNDSNTPADTSSYYVNQDGTLTKDIDKATVYTISDTSVNTVNFTPFLWNEGSGTYVLQSEHGISSIAAPITYTYTCPDASSLNVTFSARTDVDLTLNNAPTLAAELAGKTVEISGDTLTVVMPALDFGGTSKFGFAVEKVTPNYGSSTPQTGAAAVYTPSGSSENAILSDVNAGKPVRVTLVGQPAGKQHELLGALYDEKGILLDFVQVPVTFTESGCTTSLSFEEYGNADKLKIFLVDENWVPKMENCSFSKQ